MFPKSRNFHIDSFPNSESSKIFLNISFLVSQVKIAGENIFGTSQPRTVFTFATKGAGEE